MRRSKILKAGITVDAIIVRTEKQRMSKGTYTYMPILKYTFEEIGYEVESDSSHFRPKYKDGEKIVLYIDPNKPKSFIKENDKVQLFLSILFMILGLFFISNAIF